ncbi:MlaD family protein [Ancylobacter lacus]|uniref:MlaD family protein n=1 Tax=Ancylobacter lacus TaxID=2579970 RepID=UPI001BCCDCBF|nr:MlaD family protein [Ancylobacter lacus]MBS7538658.1 MCE family protein [Ancylobacter lacus]
METRANYTVIGLFTLAVIAAGFAFVWWFNGAGSRGPRVSYDVVFNGPVSGLQRGSGVTFNGIPVGEVTGLRLDAKDPRRVVATIAVPPGTPVKTDTRAGLDAQVLTGIASIGLVGGSPTAAPLPPAPDGGLQQIQADASAVQDLMEGAKQVLGRVDDIARRVDELLQDNQSRINSVITNVDKFSQALGDNAGNVNSFLADVGSAARRIDSLAASLDRISGAIDPQKVGNTVDNIQKFTGELASSSDKIRGFIDDASAIAATFRSFSAQLETTFNRLDQITQSIDPAKVGSAVDNFSTFSQTLANRSGDTDSMLRNASELSGKLNGMANKLDKILDNVDGLTSSEEGKGMFNQISAAAEEVRLLAANLDTRTAELARNLNQFTGPGLRQYEALAADGRRTLSEIERVFRNLERNPRQFIFGGSTVPSYTGR